MNRYQTVYTEEDFKDVPRELKGEFYEVLESIQFIKWLVQPEEVRGYAKNRPKYSSLKEDDPDKLYNDDRIIVDLTKPHILENLDFFRERAIFFDKHGKYTNIPSSPNPKSEYAEFWRKELRRWKYGLIRPSDGEWIPGGLYFYWNYCPIWLVEETGKKVKGKKTQGERVRKFPHPWLGDYLFYHYLEQAKTHGQHVKVLKTRGVGISFKMGSLSPRNMYVYPGSGNPNFHLASDKSYLQGDKGVFGKVMDTLDWIAEHTPLPKLRLGDSKRAMEIQLGYLDQYGVRKGLLSSVFGVSLKDNPDKARGIRGILIHYEEDGTFEHLEDAWNINRKAAEDGDVAFATMAALGCVCEGTKVWTKDFRRVNIENLKQEDGIIGFDIDNECVVQEDIINMNPPAKKECVRIHTNYRTIECSTDHPILVRKGTYKNTDEIVGIRRDYYAKLDKWYEYPNHKTITVYSKIWKEAGNIIPGDKLLTVDKIGVWGTDTLFDARLVGMLIGDGSYGMRRHYDKIEYKTPSFSNCDAELIQYVTSNYGCNIELQRPTKDGRLYHELSIRGLVQKLKDIGIAGQSKDKKRLPTNYKTLTKEDTALLLAGLYDTDGFINYRKESSCKISITQSSREMLEQIAELLEKFGIVGTIKRIEPRIAPNRKDKNPWYTLDFGSKESVKNFYENIPLMIGYKKENLKNIVDKQQSYIHRVNNTFKNIREEKVIKVERIGKKNIYNLTTSTTHTYLANNIITHNTGGTMGSAFAGSEKLFYHPETYNIYGIPNVFDKNTNGTTKCGFFWGAYLNRNGCYDKATGEPDVTKALFEVLLDRYNVKKGASDSKAITQKRAEECITPQDSIMRVEGTIFPVSDLKDYLAEIVPDITRFTSSHYIGRFDIDGMGEVKFTSSDSVYPIRDFPALDNKLGAVEIYELPKKVKDSNRYILGQDGYDDDEVTYSVSLGSVFVFDTWTRRIVAEYTGRPATANEFYEIVYRMAKFYDAKIMYENNKKGMFNYFANVRKALNMLADSPEYLSNKQIVKAANINNTTKGVNATLEVNKLARRLQADWMMEDAYVEERVFDDEGNDITPKIPNYRKIRSIGYLKEAIAWNNDINCDRVSAMGMVMIYAAELQKFETGARKEKVKTLADDPFFNKHYRGKRIMGSYPEKYEF